ncbi:FMN-dependent NADH-azoreductase [Pseudomonas sp. ANT_H12B]|uniref:FMN-dependent NADH-azoreductase n=1 Tax=Pseudomonas sp. ANT_H12B TaxID=2597348 RepID=UPI0011ED7234|nr:NAD(P)H-dependent oxidoreductase [Pseudomonas sp. ANT_H12B]KAA0968765.1 flavodoxin family protein [Pseudomonas sp. ANT_H12B]
MKILRVICSPRGTSSESYRLSQTIINNLITRHRGRDFIITERGVGGLAHVDADYAAAVSKRRDPSSAVVASGSLLQSERLIRELESADYVVIATPMHNMTIPSALKAWLDHMIQADRTFRITPEGKIPLLRDRPVFIAVASGGTFSTDNASQPDFLTPYLKAALATIGLLNVKFFSVEGTAQKPSVLNVRREKTEHETALYFSNPLPATV